MNGIEPSGSRARDMLDSRIARELALLSCCKCNKKYEQDSTLSLSNQDFLTASLRGSLTDGQNAMFVNTGRATGDRQVFDQQIRFDVSPRNMNLAR